MTNSNKNTIYPQSDKILKPKQVEFLLDCKRDKVYQLFRTKGFPSIKIGRNYYVLESEFYNWLKMYSGKEFIL